MRISDWSSDVCSSDLTATATAIDEGCVVLRAENLQPDTDYWYRLRYAGEHDRYQPLPYRTRTAPAGPAQFRVAFGRSEEHTSELQSLMRISYAVFCLKKKKK